MRIYVLTASGGSGKTATLNTLAQQLCALAPKYVLGAGCNMPPVPPWQSDGRYWFDASTAGKTVRVGICTSGDRPKFIDEAFDYFTNNKCDVGFMAAHTWGSTIDEVERRAQALNVVPQYLYLITSHNGRARTTVQQDTARFMESLI